MEHEEEDSVEDYQQSIDPSLKSKMKNDIYHEFSRMIMKKIDYFTADMKRISISQEAELRVEAFLEELVYINPQS